MFKDTMTIHTFGPGENAYGQNGGAYEGNLRKGELRGIIHINKDHCVGCDTCRKFCPTDAIKGVSAPNTRSLTMRAFIAASALWPARSMPLSR